MAKTPWNRMREMLPPAVIEFLEERDRELENYLDRVAGGSVSITAVSQAIWTPAAHASTHASSGSDPVFPATIGAYTTGEVDALNDSQDALRWMEGKADAVARAKAFSDTEEALHWTEAGKVDWTAREAAKAAAAAAAAGGGGMDEGLFWGGTADSDLDARRRIAALEDASIDALAWMLQPAVDSVARKAAADVGADGDALHWTQVGP